MPYATIAHARNHDNPSERQAWDGRMVAFLLDRLFIYTTTILHGTESLGSAGPAATKAQFSGVSGVVAKALAPRGKLCG